MSRTESEPRARSCTAMRGVQLLYPRGPRSGLGYSVPVHPHLIGLICPTRRHIVTSPAVRFIPDALAVQVRLGDPRVVPRFRCSSSLDMSPSTTTGSLAAAHAQFLRRQRWPSSLQHRLGTSKIPTIRFRWGALFEAYVRFACATTCRVVCPPGGSDRANSANGNVYFRASDGLVTRSAAGYSYRGNWASSTDGTFTR